MKLLEPHKIGNVILSNRIAMAPMTRSRANMEGVIGAVKRNLKKALQL
jgi:2,4-dienoyl-CoA reductase-like NADH-dependent reductase (Old Yellow Enzyme family)